MAKITKLLWNAPKLKVLGEDPPREIVVPNVRGYDEREWKYAEKLR